MVVDVRPKFPAAVTGGGLQVVDSNVLDAKRCDSPITRGFPYYKVQQTAPVDKPDVWAVDAQALLDAVLQMGSPMKGNHKDDKVARLEVYYRQHGDWPSRSYRDPKDGSPLGKFLLQVQQRDMRLADHQKARLLALDPTVLDSKRRKSHGSTPAGQPLTLSQDVKSITATPTAIAHLSQWRPSGK